MDQLDEALERQSALAMDALQDEAQGLREHVDTGLLQARLPSTWHSLVPPRGTLSRLRKWLNARRSDRVT